MASNKNAGWSKPHPALWQPNERTYRFLVAAFFAGAFFLAGAFLATAFLAGAFLATAFLAGAFLATAFLAGAFFFVANALTPFQDRCDIVVAVKTHP